ncbi:MAG TPA: SGNH/GDSL hydrolase family protein [Rhizomicrobium sp.]
MKGIWLAAALAAAVLVAPAALARGPLAHPPHGHTAHLAHRADRLRAATLAPRWIGSWSAAQQLPEPSNQLPADALHDTTLRQTVHLSVGGETIRIRISNAAGGAPLHLTAVHAARPLPGLLGAVVPQSDAALSFAGQADVTIPAGADILSDPLAFPVAPQSDLTISLHYDDLAVPPTGHPGARATSFLAPGNQLAAATPSPYVALEHWYLLEAVEVLGPAAQGALVALGDSITDGRGSIPNANNRWPDDLARRFQGDAATRGIGVLNMGIGGNRLLLDGLGPNALARFDRDVLSQGGVRWLILLEGINDLGMLTREAPASAADHAALVARLVAAYGQIVRRAHDHGIAVMAGTLLPFMGFSYYHPTGENEADRQALNAWIRSPGHVDAVADFDAALRDPAAPDRLLPAFDSGDHIHPSPAGYQAMADLIPLAFFAPPKAAPAVRRPSHRGKRR